jgi:hypothetical protein
MLSSSTSRRIASWVAVWIAWILFERPATAHDWYVDASAPPGGNGSASSPFRAVGDGLSAASNGDRILVAAGTYKEAIDVAVSVTILGDPAGATTLDAGGSSGQSAVHVANGVSLWLQDFVVQNGARISGGGIFNSGTANLVRCRIQNCGAIAFNQNAFGGGIENLGTMLLWECTVDSCSAYSAPAWPFYSGGGQAWGAGIDNVGTLKLFSTTISNNSIRLDIYGVRTTGAAGAGIANEGTLRIVNTTVSGNSCIANDATGGGISGTGTSTYIDHSTIANNIVSGHDAYGNGYADGGGFGGSARVGHSIFDQNSATGDTPPYPFEDYSGACDSIGYNLIDDDRGTQYSGDTTGNLHGVSAKLLPLADNGGLVQTHALDSTSPCIDAGNLDPFASPEYDARGYPRALWDPATGPSDIGAYESGSNPSYLLTLTPDILLPVGATVELATGGGTYFKPIAFTLIDLNGTSVFVPIVVASFDQSGVFVLRTTVPPGLSGIAASFRSYALDANDRLMTSNKVTLTFQ